MPVYEYRCKSCGKTHEIEHGFNDKRPTVCPSCGGELVRVFHPIGLVFKGSGFHKTDYGGASSRSPSESKSSDAPASETKSNDPKPASDGASSNSSKKSSDASQSTSTSTSKPGDSTSNPSSSKT